MTGPTYFQKPIVKVTLGSTAFENENLISADIAKRENAAGLISTITLNDTSLVPSTVTADTVVKVEIKEDGSSYPATPLFTGVVQTPRVVKAATGEVLELGCLDNGLGIGRMRVAQEYGNTSKNPSIYTITTICSDIITNFINKTIDGLSSGYSYTTDLETISDTIPFIPFAYKTGLASFQDLIDAITAFHAGSTPGPSFIVTTDNVFHLKTVGTDRTAWHKYYGNSTDTATLTYGVDYLYQDLALTGRGPNYIIKYGKFRRPSSGDAWSEGNSASWGQTILGSGAAFTDENSLYRVGSSSLKMYTNDPNNGFTAWLWYPSTYDAHWDFQSVFSQDNVPTLNFYALKHGAVNGAKVRLCCNNASAITDYFEYDFLPDLAAADTWYHLSIPVGPYIPSSSNDKYRWTTTSGSPSWSNVNDICFYLTEPVSSGAAYLLIDGLYFGGADICRVAYNSNSTIFYEDLSVDGSAVDDSLVASNDSGLFAKFCLAELLRQQKVSTSGTITTPMIADVLPGQFFKINTADYRATNFIHHLKIEEKVFNTEFTFTNDLYNGRVKPRYDSQEWKDKLLRPTSQDREASQMSTGGNININVPRLVKSYSL